MCIVLSLKELTERDVFTRKNSKIGKKVSLKNIQKYYSHQIKNQLNIEKILVESKIT